VSEQVKVIARYADGRIVKGVTRDFLQNRPIFHLFSSESSDAIEVEVKDLKAVFFVRDFAGIPEYNERKEFFEDDAPAGRRVAVTFADGEVLIGSTVGYDRKRQGFFFTPVDPQSNNVKVFAVNASVKDVTFFTGLKPDSLEISGGVTRPPQAVSGKGGATAPPKPAVPSSDSEHVNAAFTEPLRAKKPAGGSSRIPAPRRTAAPKVQAPPAPERSRAAPVILIVDDSAPIRKLVSVMLKGRGWVIHTAENGKVALEMITAEPPDVVLLDVQMPEMDGYTMLRILRSRAVGKGLPVICLTSQSKLEDLFRAEGVHGVVQKVADGYTKLPALIEKILSGQSLEI